jgi:hypothetical protein
MDSPSDMFVVASDVIREWRATVDEDGQYRSAMMTESAARSNRQICDGLRFCTTLRCQPAISEATTEAAQRFPSPCDLPPDPCEGGGRSSPVSGPICVVRIISYGPLPDEQALQIGVTRTCSNAPRPPRTTSTQRPSASLTAAGSVSYFEVMPRKNSGRPRAPARRILCDQHRRIVAYSVPN